MLFQIYPVNGSITTACGINGLSVVLRRRSNDMIPSVV